MVESPQGAYVMHSDWLRLHDALAEIAHTETVNPTALKEFAQAALGDSAAQREAK